MDHILQHHPTWVVGAVCQEEVFINRAQKPLHHHYNTKVSNLLRNPKLDVLIAEYPDPVLEQQGMFYYGSDLVVLDNPTETEMMLSRDVFQDSVIVTRQDREISIHRAGLIEQRQLGEEEPFSRVFLKEISFIE